MSDVFPTSVDVPALAGARACVRGEAPVAAFARLQDLAPAMEASSLTEGLGPVRWSAQFDVESVPGEAGRPALTLQIDAQLVLQCQRCLAPYVQAVQVERQFAFVRDETTAEALDDSSEVDLLEVSREFDLMGLIEDELLMALPIVPRHEQCPAPLAVQVQHAGATDEPRQHPFAALAQLKGQLRSGNGAD